MYVCLCNAITESKVKEAGQKGIVTAEALIAYLGLDDPDCCGYCMKHIDFFVEIAEGEDALTYVRYRAQHPNVPGHG
jgi:bacterioferritin-associated ferredoxin